MDVCVYYVCPSVSTYGCMCIESLNRGVCVCVYPVCLYVDLYLMSVYPLYLLMDVHMCVGTQGVHV